MKNISPDSLPYGKKSGFLQGISLVSAQLVEPTKQTKQKLVLTDNKSLNCFSQIKTIPAAQSNACDYVLQFSFKTTGIANSNEPVADFTSRLAQIPLKINDDIQATEMKATTSSLENTGNVSHKVDNNSETNEQLFAKEKQSQNVASAIVAHEESSLLKMRSDRNVTKISWNNLSLFLIGIKTNARVSLEPDISLLSKKKKLDSRDETHGEVALMLNKTYKHCKANDESIIIRDSLVSLKYF